jgi:hypothetical protein
MKTLFNRIIGETALFGIVLFPVALIFIPAFVMTGCTDNQRTKAFGGTMSVQIPCDQQVFDVTWKGEDLWYATQPAPSGWKPAQKRFTEYSSYGVIEGEVVLNESRCGS